MGAACTRKSPRAVQDADDHVADSEPISVKAQPAKPVVSAAPSRPPAAATLEPEPAAAFVPVTVTVSQADSTGEEETRTAEQNGPDSQVKNQLDSQTRLSLRKFGQRNRPKISRDKFLTHCAGDDREAGGSPVPALPVPPALVADRKIAKFDIFDALDNERLKEFDELFAKVRDNSNYDEHVAKSKKVDPNKFTTCIGVVSKDEETGASVLS